MIVGSENIRDGAVSEPGGVVVRKLSGGTEENQRNLYYYYYYLLQLSFHSVAVVLTLVTNKNKYTQKKRYKNTINTSTHIIKTPTQLSKHPHIIKPKLTHIHTLQNPYIHTPTH
jgi:hypothetical protein